MHIDSRFDTLEERLEERFDMMHEDLHSTNSKRIEEEDKSPGVSKLLIQSLSGLQKFGQTLVSDTKSLVQDAYF